MRGSLDNGGELLGRNITDSFSEGREKIIEDNGEGMKKERKEVG